MRSFMSILIKHRTISGVYLCNDGPHWYWGPKEQAKIYSEDTVHQLLVSYPRWEEIIGVSPDVAVIEMDPTPVTVAPPARSSMPSA